MCVCAKRMVFSYIYLLFGVVLLHKFLCVYLVRLTVAAFNKHYVLRPYLAVSRTIVCIFFSSFFFLFSRHKKENQLMVSLFIAANTFNNRTFHIKHNISGIILYNKV